MGADTMTGGEALLGQGFAAVAVLDTSQGHPGVRITGTFNPKFADPLRRYGVDIFRPSIAFIPEQYTGSHSTGLNSQAIRLLPLVFEKMNITVDPDPDRDKEDLDVLVGATAWVISQAIHFQLLEPAAPPVDPPAPTPPPVQPPSPPPVAPPPAGSGLHPLSPASVRVEELRWMFIALWPNVPPAGLVGWANLIVNQGAWATIKPLAVEALRVWRRLRAKLGDTREIPAEDR